MKKESENKGITLIALIITIIVMLILVGVTVAVAINGGLFKTAKESVRKTQKAILDDELTAIISEMNSDIFANSAKYTIYDLYVMPQILEKLEENFEVSNEVIVTTEDGENEIRTFDIDKMLKMGLATVNEETGILTLEAPCQYKGVDVNIIIEFKENGEYAEVTKFDFVNLGRATSILISETGESPIVSDGEYVKSLTEDGVPIPKGFYYVTGTKETGVVISDNQADENNESGNNGNQFVWVPVEINKKLKMSFDGEKIINEVKILSVNGYEETINPKSNYFEKTMDLTRNEAYEIIITYEDGSVEDKIYNVYGNYEKVYMSSITFDALANLSGKSQEELYETIKERSCRQKSRCGCKY